MKGFEVMDLSIFKKITDFIMPVDDEELEPEEKVEEKPVKKSTPVQTEPIKQVEEETATMSNLATQAMPSMELGRMRTVEGGSVAFGGMKYTAYARKEEPVSDMRPQLTVVKGGGISVKINKPANFAEAQSIANDLLEKNAVIVNYELVDKTEQRKISDFVNGVCYVTDGSVQQISERIVLYMPEGIDAQAVMASYSMR
ncbi:MAG: cell division protein SepF [Selenomonadaceae bacterium]|nr:cell division protein SepF [Selenomonadaceae bacterium]